MNEEQLREIAILAKELGFKAKTFTTIVTFDTLTGIKVKKLPINDTCYYLLLCEIQLWLQKNHNTDVQITIAKAGYKEYRVEIYKQSENTNQYTYFFIKEESGVYIKYFYFYEQALATGILEGLKLIKNENN